MGRQTTEPLSQSRSRAVAHKRQAFTDVQKMRICKKWQEFPNMKLDKFLVLV